MITDNYSNESFASLESNSSETTSNTHINYKIYSNQLLDIAFTYPSDWTLQEKTNRFSDDAEVMVYDGVNDFTFIDTKPGLDDSLDLFGLEYVASLISNTITADFSSRIMEPVSIGDYEIDGKETATFLYVVELPFSSLKYAMQIFVVDNDGEGNTLSYRDTISKFDSPESQEIMNRILDTFRSR